MNSREAFEAWAKDKGLIQESYGIRSVVNGTDIAEEAWQASRKQLLKELSEKEPVAWRIKPSQYSLDKDLIAEHRREFTPKKDGMTDTTFWVNDCPLIIRPTEEE